MKKLVLLTTAAAFALSAGVASAAMLKNSDSKEFKFWAEKNGKKEEVSLKSGESYDSKGDAVKFWYGAESKQEFSAKADDHLVVKGGKIEQDKPSSAGHEPASVDKKAEGSRPEGVKEESPAAGSPSKPAEGSRQ